jgi:Arc/MetJ family transcription regulator
MKRTSIVLDETLVRQGLKATGLRTRRALVHHALEELVRRKKQVEFLALKGKIEWTGDLNAMRRSRISSEKLAPKSKRTL